MNSKFVDPTAQADLRELAAVAIDLHEGRGGPVKYRHAASGLSALPTFGAPGAGLEIPLFETDYTQHTAMVFAGLVLYGMRYDLEFERLGILPGDLSDAYQTLVKDFGKEISRTPAAPPCSIADALATPKTKSRLITMNIPTRPALPGAPTSTRTALPFTTPRISLPGK